MKCPHCKKEVFGRPHDVEDLYQEPKELTPEEKLKEQMKELEAQKEKIRKTLCYELPEKYPDNCEICKGAHCGVRGNENIVDGRVMCDYCHAKVMDTTKP